MTKRKRRLEKGIKSIEKQIEFHKFKEEKAVESGKIELADYYQKEIERMKQAREKKRKQISKL